MRLPFRRIATGISGEFSQEFCPHWDAAVLSNKVRCGRETHQLRRYDTTSGGEKEIQRTLLELLNQLDGFDDRGEVKVHMENGRNIEDENDAGRGGQKIT